MDVLRHMARSRICRGTLAALLLSGGAGCAQWMSDFSPSDMWDSMTPSKETWENMSPSNVWHNLHPSRLWRLNRGPGMSTDAYYSVSDPLADDMVKPDPTAGSSTGDAH